MAKFLRLFCIIAIFVGLCYITTWAYSYQWLEKEIDRVYAQAGENGIEFLGPKPVVTGFPLIPEIYYGGGIKAGNLALDFPEARLRGYPIPGLTFTLSVPRGLSLEGIANTDPFAVDSLEARMVIPKTIPGDYKPETLTAWQKSGGQFNVRDYTITKGALQSSGKGILALDTELQPILDFESTIRGYDVFVQSLIDADVMKPFAAAATITVLNSLSRPDEATGDKIVTVSLRIRNRTLSVGPLHVARLPVIVWDTHTLPVLRQ